MNDPLAQFRRQALNPQQPAAPPQQAAPQPDAELTPPPEQYDNQGLPIYRAFFPAARKCDRLEIRTAGRIRQTPRYFDLRDISADQETWSSMVLHFALYDVFIAGRNFRHMYYALKQSRCEYVQEFNKDKFSPYVPEGDEQPAFIAQLQIIPKGSVTAEQQKAAATPQKGSNTH